MRNDRLNAHAENSTRATGSIVYIQAHFDLSGFISKARKQSAQMKIVDPPPAIETGPSTLFFNCSILYYLTYISKNKHY